MKNYENMCLLISHPLLTSGAFLSSSTHAFFLILSFMCSQIPLTPLSCQLLGSLSLFHGSFYSPQRSFPVCKTKIHHSERVSLWICIYSHISTLRLALLVAESYSFTYLLFCVFLQGWDFSPLSETWLCYNISMYDSFLSCCILEGPTYFDLIWFLQQDVNVEEIQASRSDTCV